MNAGVTGPDQARPVQDAGGAGVGTTVAVGAAVGVAGDALGVGSTVGVSVAVGDSDGSPLVDGADPKRGTKMNPSTTSATTATAITLMTAGE
ncbi:MAG TPA: hypothetical protein VF367_08090 [Candidatus Limnocylindria bacterium]